MAVKRISVHCLEIENKPGSLQQLLSQAASEGVDLLCFAAFSADGGRGKVYLSAKDPATLRACILNSGIETVPAAGFVISNDDRAGVAAEALKDLADAAINGIAGAAMVRNGQYQMLVVVKADDGDAAAGALGA